MSTLTEEITAANAKFMQHFSDNDMAALSSLYTPDCKLMPTGMDVQVGREKVAGVFQHVFDAGAKKVVLAIDEVGPMGADTCFERSHYTFYDSSNSVFDEGKYVVIWKKVDGQWFLYTDIFNTNRSSS